MAGHFRYFSGSLSKRSLQLLWQNSRSYLVFTGCCCFILTDCHFTHQIYCHRTSPYNLFFLFLYLCHVTAGRALCLNSACSFSWQMYPALLNCSIRLSSGQSLFQPYIFQYPLPAVLQVIFSKQIHSLHINPRLVIPLHFCRLVFIHPSLRKKGLS